MKRTLLFLAVMVVSSTVTLTVLAADCGSYFQSGGSDTFSGGPYPNAFSKTARWTIYFTDGYTTNPAVQVTEQGEYFWTPNGYVACYPGYEQPTWTNKASGVWNQVTHDAYMTYTGCSYCCSNYGPTTRDHEFSHECNCGEDGFQQCDLPLQWDFCLDCCSDGDGNCPQTPILIDVTGNGFSLTNARDGVDFDLDGDGSKERVAWTSLSSENAWLALDHNGNGVIDSGQELFGNFTAQTDPPAGVAKNGFLAVAELDKQQNGGNEDRSIDRHDAIFPSLRLWQDTNHNGVSEFSELHGLLSLDVKAIDLDYRHSPRVDEYGNLFMYRAKVYDGRGASVGRWAWDVYLRVAP
jgi:hypothetical protein